LNQRIIQDPDIPVSENNHSDDKTQTHIHLAKDTMVGHYLIVVRAR
jgi:hypothetical protein